MGIISLSGLHSLVIVLAGLLAVFLQVSFSGFRQLTGTQVDLLPALLVYTSLVSELNTLGVFIVLSGIWLDALSVNPLGLSLLPMGLVGLALHSHRKLIMRDQFNVQLLLGGIAGLAVPILSLGLLMVLCQYREQVASIRVPWQAALPLELRWSGNALGPAPPALHWMVLQHLLIMATFSALATPVVFKLLGGIRRALEFPAVTPSSFRPDHEMKRRRKV